jgi:hypothetical protein
MRRIKRDEPNVIRLVSSREPTPFNPATLAIDWTLYWVKLWASLLPR